MRFPLRPLLSLLCVAAIGVITVSNFSLRRELRARDTSLAVLEQEARLLRQQLEAERILAAAQARLLRRLTATETGPAPSAPAP